MTACLYALSGAAARRIRAPRKAHAPTARPSFFGGGFLYGVAPWLPFLVTACLYALSGAAARRIRAPRKAHAPTARPSFFGDCVGGWSWSLHKPLLVTVMIAAAVLNYGVNGVEYAIQLHLMQLNTSATLSGAAARRIRAPRKAHAPTARPSFFGDIVGGWSWSLHKPLLETVMIAAAVLNYGVNGVEYAIQLHLMQLDTSATLIGAIGSGIAVTMLVGAFAAARLSDRVPVGGCMATLWGDGRGRCTNRCSRRS